MIKGRAMEKNKYTFKNSWHCNDVRCPVQYTIINMPSMVVWPID